MDNGIGRLDGNFYGRHASSNVCPSPCRVKFTIDDSFIHSMWILFSIYILNAFIRNQNYMYEIQTKVEHFFDVLE